MSQLHAAEVLMSSHDNSANSSSPITSTKANDKDSKPCDTENAAESKSNVRKTQRISRRLSGLLDDLQKTFKSKPVPKTDPKDLFPYPYTEVCQSEPQLLVGPFLGEEDDNCMHPNHALPLSKDEIKTSYRRIDEQDDENVEQNSSSRQKIFNPAEETMKDNVNYDHKKKLNNQKQRGMRKKKSPLSWLRKSQHKEPLLFWSEEEPLVVKTTHEANQKEDKKEDSAGKANSNVLQTRKEGQKKDTSNSMLSKAARMVFRKTKGSQNTYDALDPACSRYRQTTLLSVSTSDDENRMPSLPTFV